MTFFDIVMELAEFVWSWRVYVCVVPAILVACLLHDRWPAARWLWFLTVPGVIGAFLRGLWWDYRDS